MTQTEWSLCTRLVISSLVIQKEKDQINTGTTSASIANVNHSLHHLSFLQTGYKSHRNEQLMLKQGRP